MRGVVPTATALLLVAAACSYSADFNGARFACDSLTPCPAGVECIDGYCQSPVIDAASDPADGAAGLPDAGVLDGDRLRWVDHVVGSVDNSQSDSVESEPISGQAGDLFVVFISSKPARQVTGVIGLGLSWTEARQQCTGRSTARLAMFFAAAPAAAAGKVTASFAALGSLASGLIVVHRYAGADLGNPVGHVSFANSNGPEGEATCADGVDSSTYSWSSLDTLRADSIVVSGVHTSNYQTHQPGDGFTERSDDQSGSTSFSAGVAVEDRRVLQPTMNLTVSGRWEQPPDWAAIAAELRD